MKILFLFPELVWSVYYFIKAWVDSRRFGRVETDDPQMVWDDLEKQRRKN